MSRDFASYFTEQYPRLVAELDFILGDTDLARDVAQDAFVNGYVSWTRVRYLDKPGAWIRRVALRMAFKTRRRMFRHRSLEDVDLQLAVQPTESERTLDVRKAVAQLTATQRSAVVLHYYRDLPVAEVSYILGLKEGNVKVHLHNARRRLAQLLVAYRPAESSGDDLPGD